MSRKIVSHADLIAGLRDLRDACTASYKRGDVDALAFVTAGNLIADAEAMYSQHPIDMDAAFDRLLNEIGAHQ